MRVQSRTLLFSGLVLTVLGIFWARGSPPGGAVPLDRLEVDFAVGDEAFGAVQARLRQVAEDRPRAGSIDWTPGLICVHEPPPPPDGPQPDPPPAGAPCSPTSAADRAAFERLPNTAVVMHQSRPDGSGRTFFWLHPDSTNPDPTGPHPTGPDPQPRHVLVHAPGDRQVAAFPDARDLGDGWWLVGPLSNATAQNRQWPVPAV